MYKILFLVLVLIIAIAAVSCQRDSRPATEPVGELQRDSQSATEPVGALPLLEQQHLRTVSSDDFSPKHLLNSLKTLHKNPSYHGNIYAGLEIDVTASDAVWLMQFVNDDTECLRLNSLLSSFHKNGPSTVGFESRRLILGYIQGHYPSVNAFEPELEHLKSQLLEKLEADIDVAFQTIEDDGK